MTIHNKYFGTIDYMPEEIIHFSDGLFGFEDQKDFLPLPFTDDDSDTIICLQSLKEESLCFILVNPFRFFPDYAPQITDTDLRLLGSPDDSDISYYAIAIIRDQLSESTINLKAPIAVNFQTRDARQIILDHPAYTFRHALEKLPEKED